MAERRRLVDVILDESAQVSPSAEAAHDCRAAIFDLLEDNAFGLVGHAGGPYTLRIGLKERRLVFDVRGRQGERLLELRLSLTPFRSVIRDYFKVCDSYYEAIKTASPSRIEAIDVGRRALHNEGADLLRERVKHRIWIDGDTARRLFTLICALHPRSI
ncbi:MAG TPA: UPF0262 family protein [Alphaproteobacteria bacterium]|jgi:uncharacterized protein (UPF0262 family)